MTHTRSLILATAVFALAGCFGENPLQPSEEGARPLVGVHASAAAGDLGTLGGNTSTAQDVNASGQIVGSSETSSGATHAFYWQNGTMTDMGTLGGASSYAHGIGDGGHIVGASTNASGRHTRRGNAASAMSSWPLHRSYKAEDRQISQPDDVLRRRSPLRHIREMRTP